MTTHVTNMKLNGVKYPRCLDHESISHGSDLDGLERVGSGGPRYLSTRAGGLATSV